MNTEASISSCLCQDIFKQNLYVPLKQSKRINLAYESDEGIHTEKDG